eukprot:9096610-Lingulodinium_polyedra.AAC.1
MPRFETTESLRQEVKNGRFKFDEGKPYVIERPPQQLSAILNERTVKSSLGVFRIQYPQSEQAKQLR